MQSQAGGNRLDAALALSSLRIERINSPTEHQPNNSTSGNTNNSANSSGQVSALIQSRTATGVLNAPYGGVHGLTLRDSHGNIHSLLNAEHPNATRTATNLAAEPSISSVHPDLHTTTKPPFNIWEALCEHEDIIFHLATQHLEPRTFLNLYSISRQFYSIVSARMTTFMLSSARRWAFLKDSNVDGTEPTSVGQYRQSDITTLLPFHHYKNLCTQDLTRRSKHSTSHEYTIRPITQPRIVNTHLSERGEKPTHLPSPTSPTFPASVDLPRSCPSFRYLFFCVHRATTARSIVATMRTLEHRLPSRIVPTLIKTGYVMDLPTNFLRQAIFHNREYWTDLDIRLLCLFCIKLDMAFTDPVDGEGEHQLRMMMMAQKTLTVVLKVLRREQCRDFISMLRMYVRWKHRPLPEHRQYSILGIPPSEIGSLEKEGWGKAMCYHPADPAPPPGPPGNLLRPDTLMLMEGARRELELQKSFLYFMISGYIDPATLDNYTEDAEVVL